MALTPLFETQFSPILTSVKNAYIQTKSHTKTARMGRLLLFERDFVRNEAVLAITLQDKHPSDDSISEHTRHSLR